MPSPGEMNATQKNLLDEGYAFADKAKETFNSPQCNPDQRTAFVTEGPGHVFALDTALDLKLQENRMKNRHLKWCAGSLDRAAVANALLGIRDLTVSNFNQKVI